MPGNNEDSRDSPSPSHGDRCRYCGYELDPDMASQPPPHKCWHCRAFTGERCCKQCGKQISSDKRKHASYCGKRCRVVWFIRHRPKKPRKGKLRKLSAPPSGQGGPYKPLGKRWFICQEEECGKEFEAQRKDACYCSPGCKQKAWRREQRRKRSEAEVPDD